MSTLGHLDYFTKTLDYCNKTKTGYTFRHSEGDFPNASRKQREK